MSEKSARRFKQFVDIFLEQIERLEKFLDGLEDDLSNTKVKSLELRLKDLNTQWDVYRGYLPPNDRYDSDILTPELRESIENSYYEIRPCLEEKIDQLKAVKAPKVTANSVQLPLNTKLPDIALDNFDGNYMQWNSFIGSFDSLVHNNGSLSVLAKFQYLKRSLKGAAALSIESLQFIEDNYKVARELLTERYNKPNLICEYHIRALFTYKPLDKQCPKRILEMIDHFKSHLRSLQSLERPVNRWDDLIVYIMVSKLDTETKSRWIDDAPAGHLPTLEDLCNFLNIRAHKLETQPKTPSAPSSSSFDSKSKFASRSKSSTSHNVTKKAFNCCFCKRSGHTIMRCFKFLTLSSDDRRKFVNDAKICMNCLHADHDSTACPSADRCRVCQQAHHSLLHQKTFDNSHSHVTITSPTMSSDHMFSSSMTAAKTTSSRSFVYLATALVEVLDKYHRPVIGRALLDSGSQINFISKSFAAKLMLPRFDSNYIIHGIGASAISSRSAVRITMKSLVNNFSLPLDVNVINRITDYQPPNQPNSIADWNIPSNIKLADSEFFDFHEIDLLIGAEIYHELLSIGQIKLRDDLPILQNTLLGWIVTGKADSCDKSSNAHSHVVTECQSDDLDEQIEKFWTIENMPHSIKSPTANDIDCEAHFTSSTTRDADGRFVVKLPFLYDPATSLGESRFLAYRRFLNLEHRLHKAPELLHSYTAFINEFVSLGHMKLTESPPSSNYYLPHHCILKPNSSSTKLRVVFDASAKSSNGNSLNNILRVGPTIQNDLFSILLRFRTHKFAFSADISKMYRQIKMHEDHHPYQLILWRERPSDELKTYCLRTVTYGTASAPYLATRCVLQLAREFKTIYPNASNVVQNDFYVDDLLTGANTVNQAVELKCEIENILRAGCMELRKWCSNHADIVRDVHPDHCEPLLKINNDDAIKTLGIYWHPGNDKFTFFVNINSSTAVTKRTIFSQIARIYDPLGLLSPVVMVGKLMIQALWQLKLDWDQSIPQQHYSKWIDYQNDLTLLNKFTIDRHIFDLPSHSSIELHGFCDASEKAYGAVIYIRYVSNDHSVHVNILCSKSRVAPLKKITLPRLELCGAVLLAELCNKCIEILDVKFTEIVLWCDSTITLQWIKGDPTRWKTFVSNRVNQIIQLTNPNQWHHVSSVNNPADMISRGAKSKILVDCALWLHGPAFLRSTALQWPIQSVNLDEAELEEIKRSKKVAALSANNAQINDIILSIKFSNTYMSVLRVICFVLRCKTRHKGPLQPNEIDAAVLVVARHIQMLTYPDVYSGLSKPDYIVKNSKLKSLNLFRDENDVIRVGGRLHHSSLAYNTKHPILLPPSHPFTLTTLRFFHRKLHHAGPLALLAAVRAEFWPVNGRSLCNTVYRECFSCFRVKPTSLQQRLGDLPMDRITAAPPFYSIGVDFCGPFLIHHKIRGKPPTKTYVCIFVCFVSKAVHLEVASDLSTAAFMGALKRMVATRGLPKRVTSDNGTNFVGANTQLHELFQMLQSEDTCSALREFCDVNRIEWKFLPPYSPNFGGLHEASVKLFKFHLRRTMGAVKPTHEQLLTLVKEIEAIMNSRPLTPLSSVPDDFRCLTPGDILIGRPLISLPPSKVPERPPFDTWKHLDFIRSCFWKRWSDDYLRAQQQRYQWPYQAKNLKLGDMVILVDENLPPMQWRLGRITKLFPGQDQLVRVVQVKTAKGETRRAISKICPLPSNNVETANQFQGENDDGK